MVKADLNDPSVQLKLKAAGIKWTSKQYHRDGYVEVDAAQAKELGITPAALRAEQKMAEKSIAAREADMKKAEQTAQANADEQRKATEKKAEEARKAAEAASRTSPTR